MESNTGVRFQQTWGPTPNNGSLTEVSKFNMTAFPDPKNEAKFRTKLQVLIFANLDPNLPYTRVTNEHSFLHKNKCMHRSIFYNKNKLNIKVQVQLGVCNLAL